MKTHRPLIIAFFALVAGIIALQLLTLAIACPDYLPHQALALVPGVTILVAMCILGEERLSRHGYLITIAIMALCWINPSGFNPGHWLPPACVLGVASVRSHKGDSLTLALIALFAFVSSMNLINTPAGSISCIAIGLLYGYTVKPQKHRKLKWALAVVLGFAPFIFRSLAILHTSPAGFSLDSLTWTMAKCDRILLSTAAWIGPAAESVTQSPLDLSLLGMLSHVALRCGKVALITTICLWVALIGCLAIATRCCATPTHRILILGGGIIFALDMTASVVKLFSNLTFVQYLEPFLSPGGSAAIASFTTLGLVIVGLSSTRKRIDTSTQPLTASSGQSDAS